MFLGFYSFKQYTYSLKKFINKYLMDINNVKALQNLA